MNQSMRRRGASAVTALASALLLLASGCGSGDEQANVEQGKRLFTGEGRCGSCHALARAGTNGQVGPSLDAAFRQARADGLTKSTFEGVVYDQIDNPRKSSAMPADLVTGQDARDVAAYVAQAAARPGEDEGRAGQLRGQDPAAARGRDLFLAKGCGGCHILSDAKTGASVGPQLNDLRSTATIKGDSSLRAYIRQGILDPNARVLKGFPAGKMPSDYRERLTDEEVDTLVDYLLRVNK
jgi:mono/diheme cytochrome c family protein